MRALVPSSTGRPAGSTAFTSTTPPAIRPALRTSLMCMRTRIPGGRSTVTASRRTASPSAACRSSAAWSAGLSILRAVSFIMTTPLFNANTMPALRPQARR